MDTSIAFRHFQSAVRCLAEHFPGTFGCLEEAVVTDNYDLPIPEDPDTPPQDYPGSYEY